MKKAINHWAFPGGMTLDEACRQAAEAGFDGIELNVAAEGLLTPYSDEQQVKQVLETVTKYGLVVPSVSTGMLWQTPLTSPDPHVVSRGMEVVRGQLRAAAWLGADTVLVVPGGVDAKAPYDQAYERALAALRQLAPEAERYKVSIGVENVWNKFLLSPLEMRGFIDAVGSPYVGAYFDIGNVLVNGFPEQWIRILGSRVRKVHLKDFKTSVGNIHGFCNLLEGDVDWPEVKKALQDVGYDGYVVAELGPYRHYPEQTIRDAAAAIDRWLASGG